MRTWGRRRNAVALAAVAAAVLIAAVGLPKSSGVIRDFLDGGVKKRYALLLEHPLPSRLAPPGYRIERIEPMFDGEQTYGVAVYFAARNGCRRGL
jgi:hypothetical protein